MKRKNVLNKKGFTLIELIVVIAILAILALILVPSITGYIGKATNAKDVANARSLYSEVTLAAATGDTEGLAASESKAITDDITCTWSYEATTETITGFDCGDLELDFLSN